MSQQYVIQAHQQASNNGLAPLGTRAEITRELERFNTAPDGENSDSLYGPGIRIDFPPTGGSEKEPVTQMLLNVTEEEIAWIVIDKLARQFHWTIVDTASGRQWSPS